MSTVWVDTKTGECWDKFEDVPPEVLPRCEYLEDIPGPPEHPSDPDSMGRANWIIEKIAEKRHKIELLKAQQKKRLRQVEADLRSFEWLFGQELEEIVRHKMKSSGERTIHMDYGTAKLRWSKKWVIRDEEKLMSWAEENNPEAIKITRKILVSQLPKTDDHKGLPGAEQEKKQSFSISTKTQG